MKKILIILFLSFFLGACKHKLKAPDGYDILIVTKRPAVHELFLSSTVQPLKSVAITSPVEGTIEKKWVEYGQQVVEKQPLLIIHSTQLEKDYHDALTQYLKSKEQYDMNEKKFEEDKILHKEGIISTNEFHSSESNFNDTYLNYLQTEQALKKILEKTNINLDEIKALMISDREAVNKALLKKFDVVTINAPVSGVMLLPEKGMNAGEGESSGAATKLIVGSQVKVGQVVSTIGDMTGISLMVPVSQVDVNLVKPGQKVIVSSDGFPGVLLRGNVVDVSAQAVASNSGGGLPTFPVHIEVKNIPEKERQKIAVGMSATVRIIIEEPERMLIPIKAVMIEKEGNKVKMFDRVTHKIIKMPVVTGQTTLNEVVILNGLLPGDAILVHR